MPREVSPLLGFNNRIDFRIAYEWKYDQIRQFLRDVSARPGYYGVNAGLTSLQRAIEVFRNHKFEGDGGSLVLQKQGFHKTERTSIQLDWYGTRCEFHTPLDLLGYILSRISSAPEDATPENYYFPLAATFGRWCVTLSNLHNRKVWPSMVFIGYPQSPSEATLKLNDQLEPHPTRPIKAPHLPRARPSLGVSIPKVDRETRNAIQQEIWNWMYVVGCRLMERPGKSLRVILNDHHTAPKFGHCAETQALLIQILRNPRNPRNVGGFAIKLETLDRSERYDLTRIARGVEDPCSNCQWIMDQFQADRNRFMKDVLGLFREQASTVDPRYLREGFPKIYEVLQDEGTWGKWETGPNKNPADSDEEAKSLEQKEREEKRQRWKEKYAGRNPQALAKKQETWRKEDNEREEKRRARQNVRRQRRFARTITTAQDEPGPRNPGLVIIPQPSESLAPRQWSFMPGSQTHENTPSHHVSASASVQNATHHQSNTHTSNQAHLHSNSNTQSGIKHSGYAPVPGYHYSQPVANNSATFSQTAPQIPNPQPSGSSLHHSTGESPSSTSHSSNRRRAPSPTSRRTPGSSLSQNSSMVRTSSPSRSHASSGPNQSTRTTLTPRRHYPDSPSERSTRRSASTDSDPTVRARSRDISSRGPSERSRSTQSSSTRRPPPDSISNQRSNSTPRSTTRRISFDSGPHNSRERGRTTHSGSRTRSEPRSNAPSARTQSPHHRSETPRSSSRAPTSRASSNHSHRTDSRPNVRPGPEWSSNRGSSRDRGPSTRNG